VGIPFSPIHEYLSFALQDVAKCVQKSIDLQRNARFIVGVASGITAKAGEPSIASKNCK